MFLLLFLRYQFFIDNSTLPYFETGLTGFLSPHALKIHVTKHHQAYVDKSNELLAGNVLEQSPIETIIQNSNGALFNNVAQHYNHQFFWRCLSAETREIPESAQTFFTREFGSVDNFKSQFIGNATTLFGSGWVYLFKSNEGKYEIKQYQNALNPVKDNGTPILCIDTWEHSWYIDYENNKAGYFQNFWSHVNWDFVSSRIQDAESH